VSGLLVPTVGGPGVKPPQPAGIWEAVGYTGSNTVRFTPDTGDKVFRRSIYTFWKRTAPPPAMNIFDAPSREACCVRRERTNTPLQALAMMNEVQYFEAARKLAERTMREASTPSDRLPQMFLRTASRPLTLDETDTLLSLVDALTAKFAQDPDAAKKVIATGETKADPSLDPVELAVWTIAGNTILNLDEVVTRN
jgi:hypothetical protein